MLLLASRDAVTTQELASALGVSLRTITRDLNRLRDAGLPVTAQRGRLGGVTMLPGSGLDLTRLTPDGDQEELGLRQLRQGLAHGRILSRPSARQHPQARETDDSRRASGPDITHSRSEALPVHRRAAKGRGRYRSIRSPRKLIILDSGVGISPDFHT
ncbi:helix-turn-helix transcriptional regulator [Streptomyces collinus]|uniref:helix-turn-helix transcriptional regulator n=1 Tax=Streptomyces collinus TaxID=42684 RepID=UPI0036C40476